MAFTLPKLPQPSHVLNLKHTGDILQPTPAPERDYLAEATAEIGPYQEPAQTSIVKRAAKWGPWGSVATGIDVATGGTASDILENVTGIAGGETEAAYNQRVALRVVEMQREDESKSKWGLYEGLLNNEAYALLSSTTAPNFDDIRAKLQAFERPVVPMPEGYEDPLNTLLAQLDTIDLEYSETLYRQGGIAEALYTNFFDNPDTPGYVPTFEQAVAKIDELGVLGALSAEEQTFLKDEIASLRTNRQETIEQMLEGPNPWRNALQAAAAASDDFVGFLPTGEAIVAGDLPEVEEEPIMPDDQEILDQLAQWKDYMTAESSIMDDNELKDLFPAMGVWDLAKDVATRPMLYAFNAVNWYTENVVHTACGEWNLASFNIARGALSWLPGNTEYDVVKNFMPFSADVDKNFKRAWKDRKFGALFELNDAYQDEAKEMPGWAQIVADIGADPANIFGWGVIATVSKTSKLARAPILGRALRLSGATEQAYIKASEWPVSTLVKKLTSTGKITPLQLALRKQGHAASLVNSVAMQVENTPIERMTAKQWERMLNTVRKGESELTDVHELRQLWLEPRAIGMDDMRALMGKTAYEAFEQETKQTWHTGARAVKLMEIDDSIKLAALNEKMLPQATDQILTSLGIKATKTTRKHVSGWLEGKLAKDWAELTGEALAAGKAEFQGFGSPVAKELALATKRLYYHNGDSIQYSARVWGAARGAFFDATMGRFQKATWRAGLERHVISPIAEANLFSSSYAPWNMLEGAVKQAAGGIKPGLLPARKFALKHVPGVSPEMLRIGEDLTAPAASYGIRDFGGQAGVKISKARIERLAEAWMPERMKGWAETLKLFAPTSQARGSWSIFPFLDRVPILNNAPKLMRKSMLDMPSQLDNMVRMHFYTKEYMRRFRVHLSEIAWGDEVLEEAIESRLAGLEAGNVILDKKIAKQVAEAVRLQLADIDNADIRMGIVKGFSVQEIRQHHVETVIAEHLVDGDPIANQMLRELAPDALASVKTQELLKLESPVEDAISKLMNQERNFYRLKELYKPENLRYQFANVEAEFAKLPIDDLEGLSHYWEGFNGIFSTYEGVPHQVSRIAAEMARLDPGNAPAIWATARNQIDDLLEETAPILERMEARLRTAAKAQGADMSEVRRVYHERLQAMVEARSAVNKLKGKFKGPGGADAAGLAHDESAVWIGYRSKQVKLRTDWEKAISKVTSLLDEEAVRIPPMNFNNRALTPEMVANHLFNTDSTALTRGFFELQVLQDKASFVEYCAGRAANIGHTGIPEGAFDDVYDQMLWTIRWNRSGTAYIDKMYAQLDAAEAQLRLIKANPKMDEGQFKALAAEIDDIGTSMAELKSTNPARYEELRNAQKRAAQDTNVEYNKTFFGQDKNTAAGDFARFFFPYWNYATHRPQWSFDQALRHPGMMMGIAKWQNATDQGYVRIGPTDILINPLRGSIFMGGWRSMWRKDYPERYDTGVGGAMAEFTDLTQRFGFYPNFLISVIPPINNAVKYGGGLKLGGLMPSMVSTPVDLGVRYGVPGAQSLREGVLSDPFYEYQVAVQLLAMDIDPNELRRKVASGAELTPEEENAWDDAHRKASMFQVWSAQTNMLRMKPLELERAYAERAKLIYQYTGVTPEQQQDLIDRGLRLEDHINFPQELQDKLNYMPYSNSSAARVLMPEEQQRALDTVADAWDYINKTVYETAYQEQLALDQKFLEAPTGAVNWVDQYRDLQSKTYNEVQALIEREGLPMTQEDQAAWSAKYGFSSGVADPVEYLMQAYFEIRPEEVQDVMSGNFYVDWDKFWRRRAGFLQAMPESLRTEFLSTMNRRDTPLVRYFEQVSQTQLQPYWGVSDQVSAALPEDHQAIISRWRNATPEGQAKLASITYRGYNAAGEETQLSIIGNYQRMVQKAREVYRQNHPLTDYYLWRWGYVTTMRSEEARIIANQNTGTMPDLEAISTWPVTVEQAKEEAAME